MEENTSCCCKSFPKVLWWLLTLLGLGLLYFLMYNANKDPIETDLSQRVMGYLEKGNMAWADINLDERGRDVLLTGVAPNEKAKNTAIKLAQKVKGVRIVEHDIFFPTEDIDLTISQKDGKIILDGKVATQKVIDSIVSTAVSRVGKENVTNNLIAKKEVKPSSLIAGLPHLLAALPDEGTLTASMNSVKYTGTVGSENDRISLIEKARMFLDPSITVVDKLEVKELKPMSLDASVEDGKMVLKGTVSSQAEMDSIVQAAEKMHKVDNQLMVSDDIQPSPWLGSISGLMALITEDGSLSVSPEGLKLTGTVDSKDKQTTLVDKAKALLASFKIPVSNGLTVVVPEPEPEPEPELVVVAAPEAEPESVKDPEPELEPVKDPESEPEPEPVVVKATPKPEPEPEPAEVKPTALEICQGELDKAMSGKSIHFNSNKAVIKQDSFPLLNNVVKVMQECQDEMAGGIRINGYTDSSGNDDYNMALSLRRAGAVRSYLIKRKVKSGLLESVGHGETNPIADNNTREGRAENRRITFIINKK